MSIPSHPALRTALHVIRDATILLVLATLVALGYNAFRAGGIPLVAQTEYQILVPCPETGEDVEGVAADDPRLREEGILLVDARTTSQHGNNPIPDAVLIPYDYLEPTPPEAITGLLHARARAIFVVGDGDDPDSGEQLARELAGKGVRHVFFVSGGAPAFNAARKGGAQ